jgi:hypothetical protein
LWSFLEKLYLFWEVGMTALQYMEEKKKLSLFWSRFALFVSGAAMIAGNSFYLWIVPSWSRFGGLSLIWTFGPASIMALIAITVFLCRKKGLARAHPEMRFLDQWLAFGGTIRNYPVDNVGRALVVPDVAKRLKIAGACVNLAFDVRDKVFEMREEHHVLSAERELLRKMYMEVASVAENEDNHYVEMWRLFIDNLRVFEGEPYDKGPELYRQTLV